MWDGNGYSDTVTSVKRAREGDGRGNEVSEAQTQA